ncbi:MAG TPA: YeeE/YedE family protein, partial [Fibrobacteres bacterium]|nr:YeeE/YedE family protein [Fibrobacterota bacterium]
MGFLLDPWPWWISGPLIGLTVGLLLLIGARNLGVSSSFRHLCAMALPKSRLP